MVGRRNLVLALFMVGAICAASWGAGSSVYPWPTNWSLGGLASWTQPLIASGSALPAVGSASTGDIFLVSDGVSSATLYRLQGGAWATMTSSAGAGGTTDHSALSNLTFAAAAHTGFDSAASATLDAASLSTHLADQTDPHGASTSFSAGVSVGSGTSDTSIYRSGTGTVTIASYTAFQTMAASPSGVIATGTVWCDSSGTIHIYRYGAWDQFGKTYWAGFQCNESATATALTTSGTFYIWSNAMTASSAGDPFITSVNTAASSAVVIGAGGRGRYHVVVTSSFSGSNDAGIEFRVFKNAVQLPNIGAEKIVNSTGDISGIAMTGFVECVPGDILDVRIMCFTGASKTVTCKYLNFTMMHVGDQ